MLLTIILVTTIPVQTQANTIITKQNNSNNSSVDKPVLNNGLQLLESQKVSLSEAKKVPEYNQSKFSKQAKTKNSYASKYGYNQLSSSEKEIYTRLEEAYYQFDSSNINAEEITYSSGNKGYIATKINIKEYQILEANLYKITIPFYYDHPDVFWSEGFSFSIINGYIDDLMIPCNEKFKDGTLRYNTRIIMQGKIETYLDKVKGISEEYEKEVILHDELVKNLDYAYVNGQPSNVRSAHTIEGAFTDVNEVVCEGYAKAFQLLLNACGIECIYVPGDGIANGTSGGHAWNMVKLEGNWYNVDVTWDDDLIGSVGQIRYDYFNQGSTFNTDHTPYTNSTNKIINAWCYGLPTGSSVAYQNQPINADTYSLTYSQPAAGEVTVDNNGIIVKTGTEVEKDTKLTVIVTPTNQSLNYIATCKVNNEPILMEMTEELDTVSNKKIYKLTLNMPAANTSLEVQLQSADIPVTGITLSKETVSLSNIGDQVTITATVKPDNATNKGITWSSDDETVATVANGVVIAKGVGIAQITATSADNKVTASCTVTVSNYYTVTFYSNNGSSVAPITNITSGAKITLPAAPTRTGFVFGGWYTNSNLTNPFNVTTPITSNISLYAKWNPIELISIDATYLSTDQLIIGTSINKDNISVYANYSDGSKTKLTNGEFTISPAVVTSIGTNVITVSYQSKIKTVSVIGKENPANITTYVMSFNTNGGSYINPITGIVKGSTITLPAVPTKAGYNFGGLYTDGNLTNAFLVTTPIIANITLYAKWNPIPADNNKTLRSISATYNGETVFLGNYISRNNVAVIATYTDNTTAFITDYSLSTDRITTPGTNTIVVFYRGVQTTFTVYGMIPSNTQNVSYLVANYYGNSVPVGYPIDRSYIRVTATYIDGTVREITDYSLSSTTVSNIGSNTVYVYYGGCTTTISVYGIANNGNTPISSGNIILSNTTTINVSNTENGYEANLSPKISMSTYGSRATIDFDIDAEKILEVTRGKNISSTSTFCMCINGISAQVLNQMNNSSINEVVVNVKIPSQFCGRNDYSVNDVLLKQDVIQKAKSSGKTIVLNYVGTNYSSYNSTYGYTKPICSLRISGYDIHNVQDFNVGMDVTDLSVDSQLGTGMKQYLSDYEIGKGTVVTLSQEGELANESKMVVNLNSNMNKYKGDKVYAYGYNEDIKMLEELPVSELIVDENKAITIPVTKFNKYVILPDKSQNTAMGIVGNAKVTKSVKLKKGKSRIIHVTLPSCVTTNVAKITYKSSSTSKATVSSSGVVRGKKAGKVKITTTVKIGKCSKKYVTTVIIK